MYRMSFFFSLPSWVQMIFYALYTAKPSKELQYNLFVNNQLVKKSTCTFVCTSYAFVQGATHNHPWILHRQDSGNIREEMDSSFRSRNFQPHIHPRQSLVWLLGCLEKVAESWQGLGGDLHSHLSSFHRCLCSQRALCLVWEWIQKRNLIITPWSALCDVSLLPSP